MNLIYIKFYLTLVFKVKNCFKEKMFYFILRPKGFCDDFNGLVYGDCSSSPVINFSPIKLIIFIN